MRCVTEANRSAIKELLAIGKSVTITVNQPARKKSTRKPSAPPNASAAQQYQPTTQPMSEAKNEPAALSEESFKLDRNKRDIWKRLGPM